MTTRKPEQLLTKCPVCGSEKIEQETKDKFTALTYELSFFRLRTGSHCKDCGTRNVRNCKPQKDVNEKAWRMIARAKAQMAKKVAQAAAL